MLLAQLTAGAESCLISGEGNSSEYLMIAVLKEFFFPFNLQGFPSKSSFTLLLPANSQLLQLLQTAAVLTQNRCQSQRSDI